MGAVDVQLRELLISALHRGDWSASRSDLFTVREGNLGVILQDCFRLTTKARYVMRGRSS
jgi:hypothetical protein